MSPKPLPSGRFNLRLPPGLHAELQRRVKAGEANSLNTLCVALIAGGIGWSPKK